MSMIQRVIVVDPSQDSRACVQRVLSKAPLFIVAETGYGARASTIATSKRPAVLLIALESPLDRGLQTLGTLRADLPDAAIVAYSSKVDRMLVREAMRAGADGVLQAPINPDDLMATLAGRAPGDAGVARPATAPTPSGRGRRTRGAILTVFSTKGGVGVSTLAANLGAAIASQTQARTLVIDLDLRFGDLAMLVDLEPEFSLADLAEVELDREIFGRATTPHVSGVDFLCAPVQPADWRPISADRLRTIIEFAARLYDYVILDAPSTLDDAAATAIELADRTLLVTSFDRTSVHATARVAQMLGRPAGASQRLRLVLNQVQEERVVGAETIRDVIGHEVYATIPFDPAVIEASQSGQPVVSGPGRSSAAMALHALAGDLAGYVPQARPSPTWHRAIEWAGGDRARARSTNERRRVSA